MERGRSDFVLSRISLPYVRHKLIINTHELISYIQLLKFNPSYNSVSD